VGGRDYLDSPFNRATQARRQPGSAFKPFVYVAALEQGMTPDDTVTDGPISIGDWRPRNFDGRHLGNISLREAVAQSINTVAVQPYGVLEIRDTQNNLLYRRTSGGAYAHMLPAGILADLNDLLSAVIEQGTGRAARIGRPAAGKTGTTSDYHDAWFVGYTPDLIATVWVGNDDNSPMKKVTGSGLPAQAWRAFMMDALKGKPVRALPEPPARSEERRVGEGCMSRGG